MGGCIFSRGILQGLLLIQKTRATSDRSNPLYGGRGCGCSHLSSVLDNEYALAEKKLWLRCWLPWMPECNCHFIPYGSVKMPVNSEKEGYLLDDYTRNLVQWDGVGIKFCTDCNDSSGSWNGHRIYAADTASEIAKKILMIMKMD